MSTAEAATERDELRRLLGTAPEVKARIAELREQVEQCNSDLEDAVAAHKAATKPLQAEIAALTQQAFAIKAIPQQLISGCEDPDLNRRRNLANHKLAELSKPLGDTRRRLTVAAHELKQSQTVDKLRHVGAVTSISDDGPKIAKRVETLTAELEKHERDKATLLRELSEIESAMLKW